MLSVLILPEAKGDAGSGSGTGTATVNDPSRTHRKETVPISLRRIYDRDVHAAPTITVESFMSIDGKTLELSMPFTNFPIYVEVEQLSSDRVWYGVFYDKTHCIMDFECTVGNYSITLTDSESITYIGYFTII